MIQTWELVARGPLNETAAIDLETGGFDTKAYPILVLVRRSELAELQKRAVVDSNASFQQGQRVGKLEVALTQLRGHVTVLKGLLPEPSGARWSSLWNALRNIQGTLDKAGVP